MSDINLEAKLKNSDAAEIIPGRRDFLKTGALATAAVLAGINPFSHSEAEAQEFRDKALLYDVFVSSFGTFKDEKYDNNKVSEERQRILAKLGTRWKPFLRVNSSKVRHNFYLDVNTIAEHADRIAAEINKTGAAKGAYKTLNPYFFNRNSDAGRYANLFVETDIGNAVRAYTAKYGADVKTTETNLLKLNGRELRSGDFFRMPVRLLKPPYVAGSRLNRDYARVTLEIGKTLWSLVSSYTEGDFTENYQIIAKFNDIDSGQEKYLAPGTMILIPYRIYKNPLNPTVVAGGTGESARIIRESPPAAEVAEPPETKAETTERAKTITSVVPGLSSVDDYLDDVRSQNLGVMRVEMPSVLTESFNVRNDAQHDFYSNDRNIRGLAESYGKGILAYLRENQGITKVITDNGHGEADPGAPGKGGKSETYFTREIQKHLANFLRREGAKVRPGLKVSSLNYRGAANPVARVRHYTREANRIGNKDDSVYISIHIDSINSNATPPPRIFVLNEGRQPRSSRLAAHMLAQAVPFYEANFRQ